MNENQARSLIQFWMRQMDGGYYPTKLIDKLNKDHELFKSIGEEAAQRIYEEEISRIEKLTGHKFPRWDSDKNTPVVGTPEAYYGSKKHLEHLEEVKKEYDLKKNITEVNLRALTKEIMSLGYDRKTAGEYAVSIGDTPVIDEGGNILVMNKDETKIIAKLKLKHLK